MWSMQWRERVIQPRAQFMCLNKPGKAGAPLLPPTAHTVEGKKLSDLNISDGCFKPCSVDPSRTSGTGGVQLHCK